MTSPKTPVLSATPEVGQAHDLSLLRLYLLRAAYLLMAVGIGLTFWPTVIDHPLDYPLGDSLAMSLLAGLGLAAALGVRYPVQMLPILIFELTWKTIFLVGFALPLWSAHAIDQAAAEDITACLMVVIFIPVIPWQYVFKCYVQKPSDRWR